MILSTILSVVLIIFSPLIVLSNILILSVFLRYKRIRTPSNLLLVSLATCDLGLGLLIPSTIFVALDLEGTPSSSLLPNTSSNEFNLTSETIDLEICASGVYCFHLVAVLGLSAMSLWSIVAIALDRFLSVSEPLRYNHFVTISHVQKFLVGSWVYISLVYLIPITFFQRLNTETLVFYTTFFVYWPCLLLVSISYGYIYMIARSHARQIISVEISLHDIGPVSQTVVTQGGGSTHHRYGLTLGLLIGDMILWGPIHILVAIDVLSHAAILLKVHWQLVAVTPVVVSIVLNPWLYAYRSSEVRNAVLKILDAVIVKITGKSTWYPVSQNKNGDLSCGSNVRLLAISPSPTTATAPGSHGPDGQANGNTVTIVGLGPPSTNKGSPGSRIDPSTHHLQVNQFEYQVSSL